MKENRKDQHRSWELRHLLHQNTNLQSGQHTWWWYIVGEWHQFLHHVPGMSGSAQPSTFLLGTWITFSAAHVPHYSGKNKITRMICDSEKEKCLRWICLPYVWANRMARKMSTRGDFIHLTHLIIQEIFWTIGDRIARLSWFSLTLVLKKRNMELLRAQPTSPSSAWGLCKKRISRGISPSFPKSNVWMRVCLVQSHTLMLWPYFPVRRLVWVHVDTYAYSYIPCFQLPFPHLPAATSSILKPPLMVFGAAHSVLIMTLCFGWYQKS